MSNKFYRLDIDNYYQLAQVMGDRRHSEDDEIPTLIQGDGEDDVYVQLAQKERDLRVTNFYLYFMSKLISYLLISSLKLIISFQ
jgi:hypothetical protein